jgi:hypothetical protein
LVRPPAGLGEKVRREEEEQREKKSKGERGQGGRRETTNGISNFGLRIAN